MTKLLGLDTDAFLSVASDFHNTAAIFKIQSELIKSPKRADMVQWMTKAIQENKEFMQLYSEKYIPRFPTQDELLACPEGSLGRKLANHLIENDINLDFAGLDTSVFYQAEVNPMTYLGTRVLRSHDVYHAVLNLGTSPLDEHRLVMFQLAQFSSPFHMILSSSSFLYTLFSTPEDIPAFLESTSSYYQKGKSAAFFPGFPFERHWETPLSDVRNMLGVTIN